MRASGRMIDDWLSHRLGRRSPWAGRQRLRLFHRPDRCRDRIHRRGPAGRRQLPRARPGRVGLAARPHGPVGHRAAEGRSRQGRADRNSFCWCRCEPIGQFRVCPCWSSALTVRRRSPDAYQVVVIGFGPTGAVAAGLLGSAASAPSPWTGCGKSTTSRARSRSITKSCAFSIISALQIACCPMWRRSRLAAFRRQGAADPPHRHGPGALSARLHPHHGVQPAAGRGGLRDHAGSFDGVEIALGTELVDFEQSGDGVTLICAGTTARPAPSRPIT